MDVLEARERNGVFRQGTGFVRTEDIHASKIFDGWQAFDDDPFMRHSESPSGKVNSDDNGQKFRRKPNGKGKHKQKRGKHIVAESEVRN